GVDRGSGGRVAAAAAGERHRGGGGIARPSIDQGDAAQGQSSRGRRPASAARHAVDRLAADGIGGGAERGSPGRPYRQIGGGEDRRLGDGAPIGPQDDLGGGSGGGQGVMAGLVGDGDVAPSFAGDQLDPLIKVEGIGPAHGGELPARGSAVARDGDVARAGAV